MRWSVTAVAIVYIFLFEGCSSVQGTDSVFHSNLDSRSYRSSASRLLAPASTAKYSDLVMSDEPIAYYRLNDVNPSMTDSGPNHLNGVFGANVRGNQPPLTTSNDLSSTFPGSQAGSSIFQNAGTVAANAIFMKATTSLTIEAWIRPAAFNATNNFAGIVAYGFGAIGNAWALSETPQSALDLYIKVNGTASSYELTSGFAKLLPAHIYQVVATYDGKKASLYINGFLVAASTASGSFNYTRIPLQYGLAIGGELGIERPTFNGSINDVSIYSVALSAAQIEQHYLAGQPVQPTAENPASSDSFVDSIGVVTHLRSTNTPYTDSWPTFLSLITSSGIRHIGDALIATPSWYPQRIMQLAASGIHSSLITDLSQTAQTIASTMSMFRGSIEAVQGPNEVDLSGDLNWINDTRAFQESLWSTVKGNQNTAMLTVIGPSVVYPTNDVALGNLSSYMDQGSLHDYFSGFNPGTLGWGARDQYGVYGSIPWNKNVCAVVAGSRPLTATETGYSSSPLNSGGVDGNTLAKYIPRTYLEHFLNGINRSTLYEFYDEPGIGNFDEFGLVDKNNTPRSSYYAIKSLIHLLADPGQAFSPPPQSFVLTGTTTNVQHLLLQKRDGTSELVIWIEAKGYDQNAKSDIAVVPQNVIFEPANLPTSAALSTIGDTGNVTSQALSFSGGAASFFVDDHVSIVTFK